MSLFQLNNNFQSLRESQTQQVNLKAKKARKEGRNIYHFGLGQSPFPVGQKIKKALQENAHQKEYLPSKGLSKLCEAIAKFQNIHFNQYLNPDRIIIGTSTRDLVFKMLSCLEGEVFVPTPSWLSFSELLRLKGIKINPIKTKRDNSYKITPKDLDQAFNVSCNPQKILYFNNPNNPTGSIYNKKEVEELAEITKKHNAIVVSDEVYALINFSKSKITSFHNCYPKGTIVASGLSKSLGCEGYRLGFIALPEQEEKLQIALTAMISSTYSSVSAPIQYASLAAYGNNEDTLQSLENYRNIYHACSMYCYKRLKNLKIEVSKPEGTFHLFAEFSSLSKLLNARKIYNDYDLARELFDQKGVATLPGSNFFYDTEKMGLRISPVDFEGEEVLKNYLELTIEEKKHMAESPESFIERFCQRIQYGMDQIAYFLSL